MKEPRVANLGDSTACVCISVLLLTRASLLLVKAYESNNSRKTMLQVAQLRAARALLGWRQEDLARTAKVGVATIRRIESQQGPLAAYVSTLLKIQAAFEQAGIQFIDHDETGGFGLRMAKKKRKR